MNSGNFSNYIVYQRKLIHLNCFNENNHPEKKRDLQTSKPNKIILLLGLFLL